MILIVPHPGQQLWVHPRMHLEMRQKGWQGWCQEYGNPLSKWGVMLGVEDGDFQTILGYIGETLSQTKQNIHFTL